MTKASAFNGGFSASENVDILAEFDFDSYLNGDDDKSSFNLDFNTNQVGSEAAPSQQRKINAPVEQFISHDVNDSTGRTNSKKRKLNAITDANDSSEPQQQSDFTS